MKARNPRAALAAIIAEGFLGRLAFGMLSFAFPLYARDVGLSLAAIGVLVSVRSIVVLPLIRTLDVYFRNGTNNHASKTPFIGRASAPVQGGGHARRSASLSRPLVD